MRLIQTIVAVFSFFISSSSSLGQESNAGSIIEVVHYVMEELLERGAHKDKLEKAESIEPRAAAYLEKNGGGVLIEYHTYQHPELPAVKKTLGVSIVGFGEVPRSAFKDYLRATHINPSVPGWQKVNSRRFGWGTMKNGNLSFTYEIHPNWKDFFETLNGEIQSEIRSKEIKTIEARISKELDLAEKFYKAKRKQQRKDYVRKLAIAENRAMWNSIHNNRLYSGGREGGGKYILQDESDASADMTLRGKIDVFLD